MCHRWLLILLLCKASPGANSIDISDAATIEDVLFAVRPPYYLDNKDTELVIAEPGREFRALNITYTFVGQDLLIAYLNATDPLNISASTEQCLMFRRPEILSLISTPPDSGNQASKETKQALDAIREECGGSEKDEYVSYNCSARLDSFSDAVRGAHFQSGRRVASLVYTCPYPLECCGFSCCVPKIILFGVALAGIGAWFAVSWSKLAVGFVVVVLSIVVVALGVRRWCRRSEKRKITVFAAEGGEWTGKY